MPPEPKAEILSASPELTRSVNTLSREMTGIFRDYSTLGATERLNKHANENAVNAAVLSPKNGKYVLSVLEDHLVGTLQIPGAGEHRTDFTRDILEAARATGKIDSRHATHLRFLYNAIGDEMNFLSRQFQNDPESVDKIYFNALSSSIDAMHELFFASGDSGLTTLVLENSPRLNELRINVLRGEKPEDDAMTNLALEASLVSAAENTTISQMNDRLTVMREQLEEKQAEIERMRAENTAGKLRESSLFQQSELYRRAADELRQQMSALKMELTNANLDLSSEREQRASLQVLLAQLEMKITELTGAKGTEAKQKKIEPKLATPEPKAPSSETATKFKAFADTLFVKKTETTKPPEKKVQLSELSRSDTLANFATETTANISNRYGLYAFLNEYFGATLNIFKEGNTSAGEVFLEKQQAETVQAFARAVETLGSDGKAVESLRQIFLSDFVFGHEYINSGYSIDSDTLMIPALASMSPEEIEKTRGLYLHIEGINEALNQTIRAIEKTSGTVSDNPYINEIATSLRKLSRGKLFTELKQVSAKIGKSAKDRPDWKKENLVEVKIEEDVTASGKIITAFQKHQEDAELLHRTLIQLGVTIDFAQLYASMPEGQKTANFLWRPNTSGEIGIVNARNPYSVFASIMYGGKRLADLTEDDLYYAKLTKRSTTTWKYYYPPKIHSGSLPKALANETPISFAISAGKPIAVFVGNNGAGKTHAMETFIQSLSIAHTAGVNYFAGQVDSPQLAEIRSLIGASSHDPKLSSFQREGTLLKSALETLSDKDGNKVAVFAVDEVGKGTDSRDAIALMIATSEYCRRNNIRLVMATHHGKQFMEIAGQLGLTPEIEIYAPEFETHELKKHEAVVDSFGIEVMEKRAKELGIPPAILETIIGNAKRTREAINQGQPVSLEEVTIPVGTDKTALPFVDVDSLRDIGMYSKSRSKRENVTYGLRPIHKLLWEGRYPSWGMDSYYWEMAENKWAERFLTDMGTIDKQGMPERHTTISSLTEALSDSETRKRVNQWAVSSARLGEGLFETVDLDQDNMRRLAEKLTALPENEDPVHSATWMSLGYSDEERLTSFNRLIASPTARSQHFRAMEQLSEVLGECPDPTLKIIAAKLRTTLSMESQLAETINQTDSDKEAIFRQAIFKHAAKELDENAYYFDQKDEVKLREIAGVNTALEYTRLIRNHIVPAIRAGNRKMFSEMQEWLSSVEMKNRRSINEIRSAFNIAIEGAEQTGKTAATLIHRGKSFSERARAVSSAFQYLNDKEIETELVRQVRNGDYKLLIEVLDFVSENDGNKSSYTSEGYLAAFNNALNHRRWINWQKQRKQMLTTRTDVDHYKILGASPADSFDDIRAKYRVIQKQCHPDLLRTRTDLGPTEKTALEEKGKAANDAWGVLGDKDKRSAYDQALSENAIQDLAFYLTTANAVHELDMTKPEFSRDGSFRVKNALAVNLLNYLSKEQIIPQSLEFGGDTDVVVIGGINGGGKSQLLIQMASILQWARATGYVPAESAVIPELNFFASAVNAGESTEAKSSFQNEIDRYNDLLKRYVEAGCPQDGIIFLDEPLAGTSSEDQQAILISLIDFFRQRNVKVILTNHNYKFYESMRKTTTSDDDGISFIPVAYLEDSEDTRFKLQYYDPQSTDEIRSDGIRVAGQMGVPQEIIDLAYYVRKQMTGTLET